MKYSAAKFELECLKPSLGRSVTTDSKKEATAELCQWFIMALSAMGKSEWAAPPIYKII